MKKFIQENFWLIVSILYVILPFDLIPEFLLPVLGPLIIVDDLAVLVFALAQRYLKHRRNQGQKENKKELLDGEEVKTT